MPGVPKGFFFFLTSGTALHKNAGVTTFFCKPLKTKMMVYFDNKNKVLPDKNMITRFLRYLLLSWPSFPVSGGTGAVFSTCTALSAYFKNQQADSSGNIVTSLEHKVQSPRPKHSHKRVAKQFGHTSREFVVDRQIRGNAGSSVLRTASFE